MRKFILLITVMLAVGTLAFGAELCLPTPPPPGVTATTGPPANTCTIGGLVFSNFAAVSAGGGASTTVTLVQAYTVGSDVFLTFNPGLGPNQDIWFYFTVTGGVVGVDLSLSGVRGQSTEVVCSSPLLPNNNCPQGTELARMVNFSGAPVVEGVFPQPASTMYIFKNIMVSGTGELSSLTQSFHTGGVPEPMSFVLIGTGLLGLGLLRRRVSR